ncbi:MAG: hypothetical protein ACRC7S_14780 [Cetobacterium sp.]
MTDKELLNELRKIRLSIHELSKKIEDEAVLNNLKKAYMLLNESICDNHIKY